MIRRPLRPLARVLSARAEGKDPNLIEAEERAARLRALHRAERARAETRLLLLGIVFILGFTTVAGRMALMSAGTPVEPRAGAGGEPIVAQRADIVDRNGAILATNIVTASLYAQPLEMIDPARAATALSEIFPDLDAGALLHRFTDGRKFVWIKRTISPEQRQLVHDLGEPGLLFGPRETRLYPNGAVLAHVLGGASFGREGVHAAEVIGVAGVERFEDARLRDPARVAEPLRLSIDLPAQIAMEDVLAAGMKEMGAKGAVGILMEADTGQIRALASLPDFDPNLRPPLPTEGDPADSPLYNRAAQGRYELGSTFKIFAVAEALDMGKVTPRTLIDTSGPMRWGRFTIRDFHDYGPRLTVQDVIVQSSNIGAARIALTMGGEAQQKFLRRLGLMDALPLEISEVAKAPPLYPKRWSELTTMTVAYGHGLAVSPLHLATAYASVANGGLKITPTIIASDRKPTEADRVVSEDTSEKVRSMMRDVVTRGTARKADVPGYEVGGKTGTADKPMPHGGYARDKTIGTFAGVFPASDPRYVMVIALDEPSNKINGASLRTAGWTAAPVFANALRRIAPIMGLRPDARPEDDVDLLYTLAVNE
ncbi:penicillin-binding protein 2 [Amaricoccus sp.]|uniref:peptidoglycan D,D-transpeptidase FtsI family protein n=1 Tax=Amaricoccus sp. TaxID=1872485 RepID=UPI001B655D26|nr:penicillin-binding protein 2 [Amaricoccus sp.]MBP7001410.1 penicillin-binding protein 2 [Amaricoccus sp.]